MSRHLPDYELLLRENQQLRRALADLQEIIRQQRRTHRYDGAALDALILSDPLQYGWLKEYRHNEEDD